MRLSLPRVASLPNRLFMLLIRLYQMALSPVLPKSCRFVPSCSNYSLQAFQRYHFLKALALCSWRILRCNPFCRGGYDPLP